eukprot:TRINITY_DN37103_c0_g1_i2.p1 TRINITY_DN37103_c0_g1~~TRINITY_DN37103_c0_g1_i2.p1  ORF type:complete len:349 (-),score=79.99 TRINITY_DN37103_c0_g1_i2:46-1092(-)
MGYMESEDPLSPLSPVSDAIRQQADALPPIAVVHPPAFRRLDQTRSSSKSALQASQSTGSLRPVASQGDAMITAGRMVVQAPVTSERVVPRRGVQRFQLPPTTGQFEGNDGVIRSLSRTEVRNRSKEAAMHFKHVASINRRARTIEDINMAVAEVRQKRSELDGLLPLRHTPKSSHIEHDNPKAPEAAEEDSALEDIEPEVEGAQTKSLAERMGYGVQLKTAAKAKWEKLKAEVQESAALKRKSGRFADLQVGNNDLKERLAKKRAQVAEEMAGFEKMDLSIPEFIETFRTNTNFIAKVSQTTGIAVPDLKTFDDAELEQWFVEMEIKSGVKAESSSSRRGIRRRASV